MLAESYPILASLAVQLLGSTSLMVTFAGLDIAEMSRQPLKRLACLFRPYFDDCAVGWKMHLAENRKSRGRSKR